MDRQRHRRHKAYTEDTIRQTSPHEPRSRPKPDPPIPLQKFLKPAMWIPGIRYPHNWWETWKVATAEPEVCVRDMGRAIENVAAAAESEEGIGGGQMVFQLASLRYSAEEGAGYARMICVSKVRRGERRTGEAAAASAVT